MRQVRQTGVWEDKSRLTMRSADRERGGSGAESEREGWEWQPKKRGTCWRNGTRYIKRQMTSRTESHSAKHLADVTHAVQGLSNRMQHSVQPYRLNVSDSATAQMTINMWQCQGQRESTLGSQCTIQSNLLQSNFVYCVINLSPAPLFLSFIYTHTHTVTVKHTLVCMQWRAVQTHVPTHMHTYQNAHKNTHTHTHTPFVSFIYVI